MEEVCGLCCNEYKGAQGRITCSNGHNMCQECLANTIKQCIAEPGSNAGSIPCGYCKDKLDLSRAQALVEPKLFMRFKNVAILTKDTYMRECPECATLVRRRFSDKMKCKACDAVFCFAHGSLFQSCSALYIM